VLAANAVSDHQTPVRLAEIALAGHPEGGKEKSAVLNALGGALYRAGRFEESIRRLDESYHTHGGETAATFVILTMVHHRLGHDDEANRFLHKLTSLQINEGAGSSWDDIEIRILRREAEALISGGRPPAPRGRHLIDLTIHFRGDYAGLGTEPGSWWRANQWLSAGDAVGAKRSP